MKEKERLIAHVGIEDLRRLVESCDIDFDCGKYIDEGLWMGLQCFKSGYSSVTPPTLIVYRDKAEFERSEKLRAECKIKSEKELEAYELKKSKEAKHSGEAFLKATQAQLGMEELPEPKKHYQLGIQGAEVYPQPLPNRPVIRFLEGGTACDTSKSFPRGELPLTLRVDEALQKIAEKEKNGCAGISFERLQESRVDDRFRKFHFLPEDIAEHLRADNEGDECWICQLMDQEQGVDHHLNLREPTFSGSSNHPLATESSPVDSSCFNEFRPKAKIDTSPRAIQWFKDKKKREREAIEKEARQVFDH